VDSRKLLFTCTLLFSIILEATVRILDLWTTYWYIDSVMHFFWGLNIFLFVVLFLKWKPLDGLLVVLAWQFFWEAGEMVGDLFITQPAYLEDHFFFDGFKDTVVDAAGAGLGWLILKAFPQGEEQESKLRYWMFLFVILMVPMILFGSVISYARGESMNAFATWWIFGSAIASIVWVKVKK
jgi:hypothetical protein